MTAINKNIWKSTLTKGSQYPSEKSIKCKIVGDKIVPYDNKILPIEEIDSYDGFTTVAMYNFPIMEVASRVLEFEDMPLVVMQINGPWPIEGYVDAGVESDECELYRRSNCFATIKDELFPLKQGEIIYTPLTTMFKNINGDKNKFVKPFSVLHMVIQKNPGLKYSSDGKALYSNPDDEKHLNEKIESIFKIANHYGHNTVIISDLGANSGHPSYIVSHLIKQNMEQYPVQRLIISIECSNANLNEAFTEFWNTLV